MAKTETKRSELTEGWHVPEGYDACPRCKTPLEVEYIHDDSPAYSGLVMNAERCTTCRWIVTFDSEAGSREVRRY